MGQEAVEPRHARIVDARDPAPQGLGSEGGLLADGQVAGPGADHGNSARQRMGRGVGHGETGGGAVVIGELPPQSRFLLPGQAGDEDVLRPPVRHAADDALDLPRVLALSEDHLRGLLPPGPVVVHLGVAQVLKGRRGQEGLRLRRGQRPGADLLQKRDAFCSFHGSPPMVF